MFAPATTVSSPRLPVVATAVTPATPAPIIVGVFTAPVAETPVGNTVMPSWWLTLPTAVSYTHLPLPTNREV